jgi:hypothetical protein
MINGPHVTGPHTRQRQPIRNGFAWPAGIFDLFSFRFFYGGNRYFPERVIGILVHNLKDVRRTGRDAITATVALIRIDTDKKIAGTVFVSEIGNHDNPRFKVYGSRYKVGLRKG